MVGGRRRCTVKALPQEIVTKKSKDIISDAAGIRSFVMIARELKLPRNNPTMFPSPDGGDMIKEFQNARRPWSVCTHPKSITSL